MAARQHRRFFLQSAGGLMFAVATGASLSTAAQAPKTAKPKTTTAKSATVKLQPSKHDLFRVRMETTVEGNLDLSKDPILSRKRERQLPLRGKSVIDFEERLVRSEAGQTMASNRFYYEANNDVTVGNDPQQASLDKASKRVVARRSLGPEVIYSDETFLTHSDLDLLRSPICSLAIDDILPTDAVTMNSTWRPSADALAALLNLGGVQNTTVEGRVVAIDPKVAKLELQGRVDGSIEGVPTSIDVAAKLTFDLATTSISWLALAVREKRDIGLARPGFEVAATIKLIRRPLDKPLAIRDTESVDLAKAIPPSRLLVNVDSQLGGFNAFIDRQWHLISDQPGLTVLRMIVDDKSVAQCEIRPLSSLKAGEQLTLEAFQNGIKQSLGNQFGEFIEAEEGLNGGQLRTMRVAVMGQVKEIPVQWVFLQFSDDTGRRLAANFTLQAADVESFGGSDAQLANSLHFTKIVKPQQATKPAEPGSDAKKR